MKKHNNVYEGASYMIEVTSNGYLLVNHSFGALEKKYHANSFQELVDKLSSNFGLKEPGEEVVVLGSKELALMKEELQKAQAARDQFLKSFTEANDFVPIVDGLDQMGHHIKITNNDEIYLDFFFEGIGYSMSKAEFNKVPDSYDFYVDDVYIGSKQGAKLQKIKA